MLGANKLRKPLKTLFFGSPSGRKPYVGSKFSMSGKEEVALSGPGVGIGVAEVDAGEDAIEGVGPRLALTADSTDAVRGRVMLGVPGGTLGRRLGCRPTGGKCE